MSTASERVVPIGVDIGGTLAKLVIFCPDDASLNSDGLSEQLCRMVLDNETYKKTGVRDSGLRLDKTAEFESMLGSFAKRSQSNSGTSVGPEVISATGGGAFKFEESIRVQLRRRLRKMDELSAVVRGISALESLYPDEVYCLDQRLFGLLQEPVLEDTCLENGKIRFHLAQSYPYLVVNVGSGVSILCCQGADRFERVSGSSLGGGTFLGLCALLTDCNTFEEALKLASQGDNTKVDKLVRDIYGGDYERFNLKGNTVASSFGHMHSASRRDGASPADLARAVLMTITNNLASIAFTTAKNFQVDKILFLGNFLRLNSLAKLLLSRGMDFWSEGRVKALFLEHEGYFGALGCLADAEFHGYQLDWKNS